MMFIYILRTDSHEVNKSVTFEDISSFKSKATIFYKDVTSQSVDQNRQECVYGTFLRTDLDVLTTSSTSVSVVSEAKITPNADPSITNEEKDRQNILIGSLGNAGASDVYLQASRSSTGLDNSALKTCNLFETLGGKCFEGIDNQFVLFGWHKNLKQLHIAKDPLNPRSIYWAE
jgi:hypothetical protein